VLAGATVLGSGGFVPTGRRETSCLLLLPEGSDRAIVLDAGTGLRRLITDPGVLQGRRNVDVLLSHFHIDHICGLPYLTELDHDELTIHGPGAALYGTPTAEILARVFSPPIMPIRPSDLGVGVVELPVGETAFGGVPVRTRRQDRHTNPTLGFRFGDALVWCTDTGDDPGTVDFARGARALGHDAWGPPAAPGHAEPAAAARIATAAGVPSLVLIHVPPAADESALQAHARTEHDDVTLATDGLDLLAL
jgi:ribonuclease BN (tRNA processing enzyme)